MREDMTKETQIQDITYAFATSPNYAQHGVCFAARGSGLYYSDDKGKTWRYAYEALNLEAPLTTMAVVVSPGFESDQSVFVGAPGGILRSFNGGKSWHITTLPSPPPVVSDLVISPNYPEDETLFAGTETGIFCSTNGGRAWREVAFSTELAPVLSLAVSPDYADDDTLFAGTESNGLFRSNDRGRTWTRLGEDAVAEAVNAIILSSEFPTRAELLAMLGDRLLVSRDGGGSWSDWKADVSLEAGAACVAAPQGLDPGAPLLVGHLEGGVLRI
jgi:photosystem II stability/assembly factor-like uncharacterized protein